MRTVHFMHGFIGFGKTTISKRLALKLPAVRLNNDDWMASLFGAGPHGELEDDYWRRINKIHWDLAESIIHSGADVIMDDGMWMKDERKERAERALKFADRVIFHVVKCDMNTARARCLARSQSDNHQIFVDGARFDNLSKYFEPMTKSEGFEMIVYDNNG